MNKVWGIIPAAGLSERMGGKTPKVLLPLGNKPLLQKTLEAFATRDWLSGLVVLFPAGFGESFRKLDIGEGLDLFFREGGSSRQESVCLGLAELAQQGAKDGDLVVVHDAARCFVTPHILQAAIDEAKQSGAVTTAVPLVDSIKEIRDDAVVRSLPRENIWAIQTPQVFRFELLREAHKAASGQSITDDAALVEALGVSVKVVLGSEANFKVTTPHDYELARRLVEAG